MPPSSWGLSRLWPWACWLVWSGSLRLVPPAPVAAAPRSPMGRLPPGLVPVLLLPPGLPSPPGLGRRQQQRRRRRRRQQRRWMGGRCFPRVRPAVPQTRCLPPRRDRHRLLLRLVFGGLSPRALPPAVAPPRPIPRSFPDPAVSSSWAPVPVFFSPPRACVPVLGWLWTPQLPGGGARSCVPGSCCCWRHDRGWSVGVGDLARTTRLPLAYHDLPYNTLRSDIPCAHHPW